MITKCILEREKINTPYLLWFLPQTEVLHNTNSERVAYLMSFGYLDEAYSMANHMLMVSRRFVSRPTKAAQIGKVGMKTFSLRFLGKYSMNQLHFKLIHSGHVSQPVVPS